MLLLSLYNIFITVVSHPSSKELRVGPITESSSFIHETVTLTIVFLNVLAYVFKKEIKSSVGNESQNLSEFSILHLLVN